MSIIKTKKQLMGYNSCLRFSLAILLLNCFTLCFGATVFSYATDKNALVSFKSFITSDPDATLIGNWSDAHDTSICDWIGVSCGVKHRRVTALNLSGYHLAGTVAPHLGNLTFLRYLDISSNNFTGFLPWQLSKLRRLKVMNASVNSFSGEIPAWLGSLPQLQHIILFNNNFSGRIPPALFNNSNLQSLHLSFNLLVGNIPKEMGSSSSLKTVKMSYNQLSGSIPRGIFNVTTMEVIKLAHNSLTGSLPIDMCDNMLNLSVLRLSANQLSGEIPSNIWKCRHLQDLQLSVNNFSGEIPPGLGNLSMLTKLYLGLNDFQGGVPEGIGNLSRLEELSIKGASLTGKIPASIFNISPLRFLSFSKNSLSGSIPSFPNLPKLEELYLHSNKLTGELPKEIGNLPILQIFLVSQNSLFGSIPSSIFNISSLKILSLSNNEFSGSLPSNMGNSLFNLEFLDISSNRLHGPIPSSIVNASKLTTLDMSNNSLNGLIPDLGNLRLLESLYIWDNNLSGAASQNQELTFLSSLTRCVHLVNLGISNNPLNGILPVSVGNFSTSLTDFRAANCNIKGTIPHEIGNISSLLSLYLGSNQLIGFIPPTIGRLKKLQRIYLSDNQLVGSIPDDICLMNNLGELGLSSNMLDGLIHECLGDGKSLRELYLDSNHFNSTIPPNFWTLTDLVVLNLSFNYFGGQLSSSVGKLKAINYLDLSFNQLSGDIPTIIDGCQSLETLNLSNNKFRGPIPQSLGNIKGLVSLDLSNNTLSGSIPKSLESLVFLRNLNVSYNKLEEEIPNGGCFLNFNAQSFVNNSALCGSTRFQVPPCSKNDRGSWVDSFAGLMKYAAAPLILIVMSLVILGVVLITRQKQKRVLSSLATNILQCVEWRSISYIDLERGTRFFSEDNRLGKGSFGSVFQATLSDGLIVAVKVFNLQVERVAKSFDTECKIFSTIRHRNILHIIGCCSNMEFKALILEYMPNGSLEKRLYAENNCLDLMQRVNIATDVALALEYLHYGYTFPIVHCDIKPSNVLLDEDLIARVSDFGIAKLFHKGDDVIQTKTMATIGYAAPEYGSEGKVSTSGDVYSYGILLLEMFTSKKPTNDMFGGEMSIKEWVSDALQNNAISQIVDHRLLAREDQHFQAKKQCVSSIFNLAMRCVAVSPIDRISMIGAATTLQKIKANLEAGTTRRHRYAISITA